MSASGVSLPTYESYTSSGRNVIASSDFGACIGEADCIIRLICDSAPDMSTEEVKNAYFLTAEYIYLGGAKGKCGIVSEKAGDFSVTYSENENLPVIPKVAYCLLVKAGYVCRAVCND